MNLFIDTNVFLSFFRFTSENIEELKKLSALIASKKITLLVSQQLKDEYARNRENVLSDSLKRMRSSRREYPFPAAVKELASHAEAQLAKEQFEKEYNNLIQSFEVAAEDQTLAADKLNSDLFSNATEMVCDDAIFGKAVKRWRLGNPPRKNDNSIGDAVHWECLLNHFSAKPDNIIVVSSDGDFADKLSGKNLRRFLSAEWQSRCAGSTAVLYDTLSAFFKEHFPEIKLASDVSVHGILDELENSRSFAVTHYVVSKIDSLGSLSKEAAKRIIDISLKNSQVGGIRTDRDLFEMFKTIKAEHAKHLDKSELSYVDETIAKGAAIWDIPGSED
ncbi:PIN domain-containing protein [Sulfitobacter sp. W002]|uniref:PIN domain-containing protein n=1 Tax=Sulfitobacter sp. W002 TaxID=2867024 RepID=UPI0021A362E6|nr:PIN domain-containing protein [Sulfitobacter sp. W002]UWR30582.1 PIN domain-containing protein [Sulfitobacter sp. W002]